MADETPPPDYASMSGAEFQTAVGADPERWAAAFLQVWEARGWHVSDLTEWFRDAMDAARKQQRQLDRIGEGQ